MSIPLVKYISRLVLPTLSSVIIIALGNTPLLCQQSTARNVFWSASDLVDVAENPGAKAVGASEKHPIPTKDPAQPNGLPTKKHLKADLAVWKGYGQQPQLIRVSAEQIGIRYALLLRDSTGHYGEVSPNTIFRNGDHLRLSIMANQPGFLYVIQQGSTGSWTSLFPQTDQQTRTTKNEIEPGMVYQIPDGKDAFRFDEHPGQERLFVVLSRQRISDLDGTITSLQNSADPAMASPVAPSHTQEPGAQSDTIEAANRIPDAFVQTLSTRDLTLVQEETVDDKRSGDDAGEKAVYVVSKASSVNNGTPQVAANIILHHE